MMKENRLIAEFMDIEDYQEMGKYVTPNYHNSWDWLMPVLKKIKLQVHPDTVGMWRKVTQPIGYDIHEVHEEAVQFIKTIKIETESNELIAEFMDMEDHQEMGKYVTPNYHNSWDWLMPVVDKIENFGFEFIISENRVKIKHNTDHSLEELFHSETIGSKLNTTYKAVVEFIKEFNK